MGTRRTVNGALLGLKSAALVGQAYRHAVWMVDFSTGKILTERE
jgi:hypothetical protein